MMPLMSTRASSQGDDRARTVHVVPHTHWDREWYLPFETFQLRLGDVAEAIVDLLERDPSRYPSFTLDGQAILLEDIVDLRPDLRDRIERHVRDGRLRIGPWYVLSDEFLTSPEALVKNMELGMRACQAYGGAMQVAYTPDSFGHIAHMPTIIRGFGLDAIVFQRGVGDEGERLGSEFTWRSPDGASDVLAVHLVGTYSPIVSIGHDDQSYCDPLDLDQAATHLQAILYGNGASNIPEAWLRSNIERVGGIAAYANGPHLLLLNGSDHLFPQPTLPDVLDDARRRHPHLTFLHTDIEHYVEAVREDHDTSRVHQDEFRGSRYYHVLSGVWSARMPLKTTNHAVETLLERYAGPLLGLSLLEGGPDDRHALDEAWRTLLRNHPHDSICGCSIDPVADAMMARFARAERLAHGLVQRAVTHLAPQRAERTWTVFTPTPDASWGTVALTFDAPRGSRDALRAYDTEGQALPMQVHVDETTAPGDARVQVERVSMRVATPLTPMGLSNLTIAVEEVDAGAAPEPTDPVDTLRHEDGSIVLRNAALELQVHRDGTLLLIDRAEGLRHAMHLCFEDQADAGDSYDYSPVRGADVRMSTLRDAPRLALDGPLRASVSLRHHLELPERLAEDRCSFEGVSTIEARLTVHLDAFADTILLDVEVDNSAHDHRLRLWLENDLVTHTILRDTHWATLRSPIDPPEGKGWHQAPTRTHPIRRFAAMEDEERTLALVTRGLPEVEGVRTPRGTALALTLLRSIGWLSRDDLASRPQEAGPALEAPGAQQLGPFEARLAIAPSRAGDTARLTMQADRCIAPPMAVPSDAACAGIDIAAPNVMARPARGWTLTPPLTLSTITPTQLDGPLDDEATVIVRIYNAGRDTTEGILRAPSSIRRCHIVRLDQTPIQEHAFEGTDVPIALPHAGVLTLAIELSDDVSPTIG